MEWNDPKLVAAAGFAGVTALYLACGSQTTIKKTATISNGQVVGKKRSKGSKVTGFLGIPYAEPLVGERRFQDPVLFTDRWKTARDCTKYGPVFAQPVSLFGVVTAGLIRGLASALKEYLQSLTTSSGLHYGASEDALHASVFTPVDTEKGTKSKLPVMVWIHGGAYYAGSMQIYEGWNLAEKDVVVVTFQYRLGLFGFPPFVEESECRNLGIKDQICALQWVKREIANFGGDPNNITVFGESAGAMSIGTLIGCKDVVENNLFHKAIFQSGGSHNVVQAHQVLKNRELVAQALKCKPEDVTPQNLRKYKPGALVAALTKVQTLGVGKNDYLGGTLLYTQPAEDGDLIGQQPLQVVSKGATAKIPMLMGCCDEEWALFTSLFPVKPENHTTEKVTERFQNVLKVFNLENSDERCANIVAKLENSDYVKKRVKGGTKGDKFKLHTALHSEWCFRVPCLRLADAQVGNNGDVYMYKIDFASKKFGAMHAIDIPLIMGNIQDWPNVIPRDQVSTARQLCQSMQDAWVEFAKTGNPSTGKLHWPKYNTEDRPTMIFGTHGSTANCEVYKSPDLDLYQAWDGIRTVENMW